MNQLNWNVNRLENIKKMLFSTSMLFSGGNLTYPHESEVLLFRGWGEVLKGGVVDTFPENICASQ